MDRDDSKEEMTPTPEDSKDKKKVSKEEQAKIDRIKKAYAEMHITHLSLLDFDEDEFVDQSD